jgi:hypothetical protein
MALGAAFRALARLIPRVLPGFQGLGIVSAGGALNTSRSGAAKTFPSPIGFLPGFRFYGLFRFPEEEGDYEDNSTSIKKITPTAAKSEYGLGIVFKTDKICSIILKASLIAPYISNRTSFGTLCGNQKIFQPILYICLPLIYFSGNSFQYGARTAFF